MGGAQITLDSIVVAAKDQVSSDLGAEIAILGLARNTYYSVGGVGRRIWELVQSPITVSELLAALLRQYTVEPVRCREDLLAMLAKLRDEGLVEVGETRPA